MGSKRRKASVEQVAAASPGEAVDQEFGSMTLVARRLSFFATGLFFSLVATLFMLLAIGHYHYEMRTDSLFKDFSAFWSAAETLINGRPLEAFDWRVLLAAQSLEYDPRAHIYLWLYPPYFHLAITPLGFLGMMPGFVVYSLSGLLAYIAALFLWGRGTAAAPWLAMASPAVFLSIYYGNISLIWTALLLFALRELERERDARAGLVIALLTIKPQLGLLIPVALLAGRRWRAILWAAVGSLALVALGTAVLGLEYWSALGGAMAGMSRIIAGEAPTTDPVALAYADVKRFMISWYALGRSLGLGHEAAIGLHVVAGLAAALCVALAWSRPRLRFEVKAAILCLAIVVATPYAFSYELALASAAIVLLARAGCGRTAGGRAIIAALWLLPIPGELLTRFRVGGLGFAHYVAPLLTLALVLVFAAAWKATRRRGLPAVPG